MTETPNAAEIAYWNEQAGPRWVQMQDALDRAFVNMTALLLARADPQPGERVLDIGCGAGTTVLAVAERVGAEGHVTGVDVSAPMLDLARTRVAAAGLGPARVTLLRSDAATHDFVADTFDRALSRLGVMFFDAPEAAFANIRRGLRAGAPIAFVCFRRLADNPWFVVPFEAARPHLPPMPQADPLAPGQFAFANADRVRGILSAAGFRDIAITAENPMMEGGKLDEACALAGRLGPLARASLAASPEQQAAAMAAVRAAMAKADGPLGVRLPAGIWVVSARA
jgi:SAM-dependent methyltransferase